MNNSFKMGVIGFVIGLPLFCYLQLKSDTTASAKADTAASEPTGPEPTAIPQPKKQSSTHARRFQQATAGAAPRRTPVRKTAIKPQRAKDTSGSEARRKKADAARTGKVDQSKSKVRGSKDSEKPAGKRPARQPQKTRRPVVPTTDAPAVARNRRCQIHLNRILVGEEVVTKGVFRDSTLDEQAKHGKYVVYFELSIRSQERRQNISVSFQDFRLEDSAGLIYAPIHTNDRLSATLAPGKTARGGVAFAVYNDGAPARLLFRTGEELFTPLPESLFWNRGERGSSTP
jgi:hypothetical protein